MSIASLRAQGWTSSGIRAQIDARRWQRIGRAVVLHNGPATTKQLRAAALIVLGRRAVLTSFTALDEQGLTAWVRDEIHVLVPRGARIRRPRELNLRVHYTDRWGDLALRRGGTCDAPAHAALVAASSFQSPRPACGVLAATVQQRLVMPSHLIGELGRASRLRHHKLLLAASHDIAQGAQALSEIDFAGLCRRNRLPQPTRQSVRVDRFGRRRYLDAEWLRKDGRPLAVEVDGALHLAAPRWWEDQLRQNELVIQGDMLLRFPSAVIRAEEPLVVDQLRRALL